ncbi:hypothetical protein CYMTET_21263 [Cymbomonas tetramitiformis]|uniref:Uncharacterized protein n=1 Tax=Cymbomonas tetramitiformis TaxID=36881 RepID=A0AAE0G2R2_9CHLO|nr:hypothetical protein CYMTET_21263 [Cymbomonas tetramitiformis]
MLELRGQLEQEPGSSQRGGSDALRAKLQFVEDRVYQAADGVVADEVLQQWLNDFDKNRGKALLNTTAKNAANADARAPKDHRDQRWKDRKKYDEEKHTKKPDGKGGKGQGAKPSADGKYAHVASNEMNSRRHMLLHDQSSMPYGCTSMCHSSDGGCVVGGWDAVLQQ